MTDSSERTGAGSRGPRGPYARGIRRRHQILEAATRVFGQRGYAGGSLRQVADGVGVSPAVLIRYFGSKEGLFTAVLEFSEEQNRPQDSDSDSGLAYLRYFAAIPQVNVHNRGLVELLLTVATEASDPEHPAHDFMSRRYRLVVDRIARELRTARDRCEIVPMDDALVEVEARGFVAMMDGLGLQWLLHPELDLEVVAKHHFDAILTRWTGQGTAESR